MVRTKFSIAPHNCCLCRKKWGLWESCKFSSAVSENGGVCLI